MLYYNKQYPTHPLYRHLKSWVDMEDNYVDHYYIMNTSLHAAEALLLNSYGIYLAPSIIKEYFGNVSSDILYPQYKVNNIMGAYTN